MKTCTVFYKEQVICQRVHIIQISMYYVTETAKWNQMLSKKVKLCQIKENNTWGTGRFIVVTSGNLAA